MGEWITIPAFADGTLIRATVFQDMWTNLYSLKDGEFDSQQIEGVATDFWSTTNTSFVPVHADYYTLTFESFGGDLLIIANAESSNADASSATKLTVFIDGVNVGGTNGLHQKGPGDIFEAIQLLFIATGIAAGTHVIYMAMSGGAAADAKVFKRPCMNFNVMELS